MTRAAAIAAVLGAVQERWGIHSLTRGYAGARGPGALASRAARAASASSLPPWWPGAEGYLRPTVLELSGPASCGKLGLALLWLAAASRGGLVAVVDLAGTFYPPAAAAAGLDLDRLVVVRPPDRRGAAEAVSLLLSSAGFDAVLWPLEWRTRPFNLDSVRLTTLAARSSTTLLALVTDHRRITRPGAPTGEAPTVGQTGLFPGADLRLRVTGWEWTWRDGELAGARPRVRTERLRGAPAGQAWELHLEHHAPDGQPGFSSSPAAPSHPPNQGTSSQAPWERGHPGRFVPGPAAPAAGDEASTWPADRPRAGADERGGGLTAGRAADLTGGHGADPGAGSTGADASARPGRCPPTDHLCLAAAFPLGGGGARATGPAGAADRGVRSDEAPEIAARSA